VSAPSTTSGGVSALTDLPRFSAESAFNQRIAPDAAIDPDSSGMVALISGDTSRVVNLFEFGVPVYWTGTATPLRAVRCTMPWGTCAPQAASPVPIPDHARPNRGSDGALVVIDAGTRRSFEYWQAVRSTDGNWHASWASINNLDGTGTGTGGSGSRISRIAGMVTIAEASQPEAPIRHALAVSTKFTCTESFRYPATQTDGAYAPRPCLPEGARLQLDPAVDIDKLPDITPGEAMIARALQRYGAYVVDSGGASLAFLFEQAPDARDGAHPGKVYQSAGFKWDYFGLRKIPWTRVRVLAPSVG
jgi:hypothetical protein